VTYVLDEPRHRGFAYGRLPGHPERGEEAFALELHDDGAVTFTITAFSRPASLPAKAGGPLSRAVQARITTATCAQWQSETHCDVLTCRDR
jgi:uncharacterized protein (UPF0548 family)